MTRPHELEHETAADAPHPARGDGGGAGAATEETAAFLLDLAGALHRFAVPSDVVEDLIERAARRLGVHANVMVLQGYLALDVAHVDARRVRLRRVSFDTHWRLNRMADAFYVAKALGDGQMGMAQARVKLDAVLAARPLYGRPLVYLGYTVYGAAVAARVGGRAQEMIAGAIIGLAAGLIHFDTLQYPRVDLQKSAVAGAVGGLLVLVLALIMPGLDLAKALFGGVSLLVPAMVVVIGTHELANEALESGVTRLAYGLLRFVMLGVGIAAALRVWNLFAVVPSQTQDAGLPAPAVLAILVAGGVALVPCLQVPRRDAVFVVVAVLVAHGSMVLSKLTFGEHGAPLACAFMLGAFAQLYGHIRDHFVGTVMVPGLLQIAPGFLGTTAVLHLLGGAGQSDTNFFSLMLVAMQLVVGLLMAHVVFGRKRVA
jgi:uncharacterized membrane protein YjjP (DUF1212 family)/uncharacterized membrane protein YjjB (DUF3815 family)